MAWHGRPVAGVGRAGEQINICSESSRNCSKPGQKPGLFTISRLRSALPADLNADAGSPDFNTWIPVPPAFAAPASVATSLRPNLVAVAVAGFDASLLTNRAHTLLPTHTLGAGLLGNECNRGHHSGCDRKCS